ncbi:MAG TPA: hypothetical protein PKJ51_12440 [Methanothrix sp.]|nr:hypothetical protein [Methanothrix sp.]
MAYESTWAYGDYDLADIDTRLAEILLSAELTDPEPEQVKRVRKKKTED